MKHTFTIQNQRIKDNAIAAVSAVPLDPLHEIIIRAVKSIRSLEQNAKMWAMLTDISKQVVWHGLNLEPHEWKEMITAAIKKQKVVPGIDGGFVVIGASTSRMSIKDMIDVVDFCYAFGADPDHEVKWTEPDKYEGYR